ncbi:hypothetical protein [Aliamphritea ceti]|uniref:hypothetical protein n=1 Tax=Aliamphritea ceti TaxID=1524258 RepID=UPI0021C3BEFF|nr:hypothetical protein [Aliamphritea ceti]
MNIPTFTEAIDGVCCGCDWEIVTLNRLGLVPEAGKNTALVLGLLMSLPAMAVELSVNVKSASGAVLEGMVVYAEPLDGQQLPATDKVISVGQKGKSFTPYVSVSQAGNNVLFDNQDNITHHIYSVDGDSRFSFKIKAGEKRLQDGLNSAGEVAMGCNIHDWMSGYILLVDTPLFAKTAAQGNVSFDVSETGRYKVTVWHPQLRAENNREAQVIDLNEDIQITAQLINGMEAVPSQESDDDFDFISDY